eukprot:3918302-Pyramimonas_sp.AAC.2
MYVYVLLAVRPQQHQASLTAGSNYQYWSADNNVQETLIYYNRRHRYNYACVTASCCIELRATLAPGGRDLCC